MKPTRLVDGRVEFKNDLANILQGAGSFPACERTMVVEANAWEDAGGTERVECCSKSEEEVQDVVKLGRTSKVNE